MDKFVTKKQVADLLKKYPDYDVSDLLFRLLDEKAEEFIINEMTKQKFTYEDAGLFIGGDDFWEDCQNDMLFDCLIKYDLLKPENKEDWYLDRYNLHNLYSRINLEDWENALNILFEYYGDDDDIHTHKEVIKKLKQIHKELFED